MLALPKSQIATMEELSAEVKALVAEGKRLKGNHGAAKRHEGALAGALRRMTKSEMDALVARVTAIETGTTGAIDSNVDALAMSWRARLLSGTEATTASSWKGRGRGWGWAEASSGGHRGGRGQWRTHCRSVM